MESVEIFEGRDSVGDSMWMSRWSDTEVRDLFGTDVLPTAYRTSTPLETVLQKIRGLNPGCVVSVTVR